MVGIRKSERLESEKMLSGQIKDGIRKKVFIRKDERSYSKS